MFPSLLDTTIPIARIPFLQGCLSFSRGKQGGALDVAKHSQRETRSVAACINRSPPAALTRTPFTVSGVVTVAVKPSPIPHAPTQPEEPED